MGAAVTELKNVEEALGLRRGWKNFQTHVRKSLDCLVKTIDRNIDLKDASAEASLEIINMLSGTGERLSLL